MDFLQSLLNIVLDYFLFGIIFGFIIFVCRTVLVLFCRKYKGENTFFAYITHLFLSFYIFQVNKLELQVLVYTPKIDGKKVTVQDAIADLSINYVDPLIIEQDHHLSSTIFNKHSHLLFYKIDDLTVKGFFHDLKCRKVYTAKIKELDE